MLRISLRGRRLSSRPDITSFVFNSASELDYSQLKLQVDARKEVVRHLSLLRAKRKSHGKLSEKVMEATLMYKADLDELKRREDQEATRATQEKTFEPEPESPGIVEALRNLFR